MITLAEAGSVRSTGWSDLAHELDLWSGEGRTATLWWRDDDAVAAGNRLDRLLEIAGDTPVSLAVIPARAEPGLAARLAGSVLSGSRIAVLQHGWNHANQSETRKSEFPAERSATAVAADLGAGRTRLAALFAGHALAVLAPPWNRIADCFLPRLGRCGIAALSRLGPRRAAWPAAGLFEANVHVDLVAWRTGRGFVGEAAALGGLVGHLRARRLGGADSGEPSGILTHHLVQDAATSDFLDRLVRLTSAHPAVRWLSGAEVFAPVRSASAPKGAVIEAAP
ncbi:MAG: polysaccharide deacetylase family protein [Stellaceae bacterium]